MNPMVGRVGVPPIAELQEWVRGRHFAANRPLLDVAQAAPSYPPARPLREHLAAEVVRPGSAAYAPILGLPELRRAFAGLSGRLYGATLDSEAVAITAGCNQAFCVAAQVLAAPGDEVLLPVPYYFNHRMWLDMLGVVAREVPRSVFAGSGMDLDALDALSGPRTRALVLVSPNNPTGAVLRQAQLELAFDFCARRGMHLVLDETYRDFLPGGERPHELFQRGDWQRVLVQLYSFSKAYALAGYRVGALVAGPEVMAGAAKVLDCVTICAPRISQVAALFGAERLGRWRANKRDMMDGRMRALRAAWAANRPAYELVSSGAYFAWVRHPFPGVSSMEVARRLAENHDLLCVPGSVFGPDQERFLRFAFANLEEAQMGALIERLHESTAADRPRSSAPPNVPAAG